MIMNKNGIILLLSYLLVYPVCYLIAMIPVAAFSMWLMNWDFEGAKRFYLVIGIIMGLSSYYIHFNVFRHSFSSLFKK